METLAMLRGESRVDELVLEQLEAIELALGRGDVGTALTFVSSTRRWLAGASPDDGKGSIALSGVALTKREVATLRLLPDASMSQKDMARALGVSRNTVKSHLKSIYLKLGVHCRAEAIHRARSVGLIGIFFPMRTGEASAGVGHEWNVPAAVGA